MLEPYTAEDNWTSIAKDILLVSGRRMSVAKKCKSANEVWQAWKEVTVGPECSKLWLARGG